jgi:hypothetical protein
METLRDSVETSVTMNLFGSQKEASYAHIFKSTLTKLSIATCAQHLDNFNPNRLQSTAHLAYPIQDRPRNNKDITSVKYHQKNIQRGLGVEPIWVFKNKKDDTLVLLDGAHRIVASYIENQRKVPAYIVVK